MCLKFLVILRLTSTYVYGWNSEDLELFDLVEEVNENFYDVLGISQVSFERSYNREETPLSIHTAGRLYSHLPNIDLWRTRNAIYTAGRVYKRWRRRRHTASWL